MKTPRWGRPSACGGLSGRPDALCMNWPAWTPAAGLESRPTTQMLRRGIQQQPERVAARAFGNDGNTLYVASGGGEQISVVDLTQGKVTGRVLFPQIPFNASFSLITPALLASSQHGPQVIMSDGTLWKIVGNQVTPRTLNTNIFGTARSIPAPQTMASTPEGSYVLILGGNGTAFLYSAASDDFVAASSVIPTPITGYYGPIAAGPNGQYYL